MNQEKFCLQCDDGTVLVHGKKDLAIKVNDLSAIVPSVSGWHCPVCGECEFDDCEGKRYSGAMNELRQQAIHQRAVAVRHTRRKLKLNQAEAGLLFGGGATAFSEYERGKTQPHKSTVLLLKLLDKHPDLLDEIRAA